MTPRGRSSVISIDSNTLLDLLLLAADTVLHSFYYQIDARRNIHELSEFNHVVLDFYKTKNNVYVLLNFDREAVSDWVTWLVLADVTPLTAQTFVERRR